MPDIKKVIDNPDTNNPELVDRALDLEDWDEEQGRQNARKEGIELTDEHWEVVHCLRQYHMEKGVPENGREVSDWLANEFADRGGLKYLRLLLPNGPVAQGMHIAGLPIPAHTEDEGLGTSH